MIEYLSKRHLTHPVQALVKQFVVAFVAMVAGWPAPFTVGAIAGIFFFWGREVRDCEWEQDYDAHGLESLKAYLPWNFSDDNHLDFWPVVLACLWVAFVGDFLL